MKYLFSFLLIAFASAIHAAPLSPADKTQLLDELTIRIESHYVMTHIITKISADLEKLQNHKDFTDTNDPKQLAKLLSQTLKKHDKHFTVQWQNKAKSTSATSSKPNPSKQKTLSPSTARESWFSKLDRKNAGFREVKILDGNIGYLEFWGFDSLNPHSEGRARTAMNFLAGVDAMIIDLRENGGGSPEMIQFLSSYFLAEKTHLNSFYNRDTDQTTEFWTLPDVQTNARPKLPLYILTSNKTFSAAEEFTYNLKHLQRATIVGETTKGGANPWRYYSLKNGFRAGIPNAKAINPITQTNWEGVGVKPHHEIGAKQALDKAHKLALKEVLETTSNFYLKREIERKLEDLKEEI